MTSPQFEAAANAAAFSLLYCFNAVLRYNFLNLANIYAKLWISACIFVRVILKYIYLFSNSEQEA